MTALFMVLALPLQAQTTLPALHDVTGVAGNDVLNLRQAPDAGSPAVGSLPPNARDIEIVEKSADGKWGRLNHGEGTGWAALRFLRPQDRPEWFTAQGALDCRGTEPFWSVAVDPAQADSVTFTSPEEPGRVMKVTGVWPGETWRPVLGVTFDGAGTSGMAVIRGEACNDGMSDMAFGLAVDLFLTGADSSSALRGCCTITP